MGDGRKRKEGKQALRNLGKVSGKGLEPPVKAKLGALAEAEIRSPRAKL